MIRPAKASPKTPTDVSEFIRKRIKELQPRKSQKEIAAEAGYANANNLSMIKTAESKLPLERVPALANALECDVVHLFKLAMLQYFEDDAIKAFRGAMTADYTDNEKHWIAQLRKLSKGSDPECTPFQQRLLDALLNGHAP